MAKTAEIPTYPRLEMRDPLTLKRHEYAPRQRQSTTTFIVGQSLAKFGLLKPPVVNARTGKILSLYSVVEAAQVAKWTDLPVWVVDLGEAEELAAMLMLNSHLNDWDWESVATDLRKLVAAGFPLLLTGLAESDTGPLLAADWKPAALKPLNDVQSDAQQAGFNLI